MYRVARGRARAFAVALRARGLLDFAEPDRRLRSLAFPADPLSGSQWNLAALGLEGLTPPPVTDSSVVLGLIEGSFDPSHPEWQGARFSFTRAPTMPGDDHGTAVASVAGAPDNERGIVGVWPGMRMVIAPPNPGSCGDAVRAIREAVRAKASVLNMSYAIEDGCFAHRLATNMAYGQGVVLVAAGGNEFGERDAQFDSPGGDPHVITVAALDTDFSSAFFSNRYDAIDIAAPGVDVPAAVSLANDNDGNPDGYRAESGTSFSAPLVAAGASWVWERRPRLDHTQLTDLIRHAARDLGRRGWDPDFGFGAFQMPLALSDRAPAPDPVEPNDDIEWVNGRHFRRDPAINKPRRRVRRRTLLSARLDRLEDPTDVYRVVVGAGWTMRIRSRPRAGDPDLDVFSRRARTVYYRRKPRTLLGASRRPGRRIDTVYVRNRSRRPRFVWVAVYPTGERFDAAYRLEARRVRPRRRAHRVP